MPFILMNYGLNSHTTEELAKLQLARHFRHANKVRDPAIVDEMVMRMYERLANISSQDVWGGFVAYIVSPHGLNQYLRNQGYSYLEDAKFGKKSNFMKDFYTGGKKNFW